MFTELEESAQATLYVDGTARLLTAERFADVSELNLLMEMLERRVTMLGALRSALTASQTVAVRIGAENELPALRRWRWSPPATGCRSARSARSR